MNEKEKAIAALKALAESKDEDEAKSAKAALKAMGADASEDEKSEDDKADDKAEDEKDGESSDESDEDKDEKKAPAKDEAKAAAASSSTEVTALADRLSKLEAKTERTDRARLLASRPDFAPEMVAFLKTQPLAVVRDAVKAMPKKAPAGGPIANARAAIGATPTTAATQGKPTNLLPEEEARKLDIQMGLAKPATAIRHEGNRLVLGVLTPAEARAQLAQKKEQTR